MPRRNETQPSPRAGQQFRSDEVKRAFIRAYALTGSILEACRSLEAEHGHVPRQTAGAWLRDPKWSAVLVTARRRVVRAAAQEDIAASHESAQGVREGVAVCRSLLRKVRAVTDAQGVTVEVSALSAKDASALLRAIVFARASSGRRAAEAIANVEGDAEADAAAEAGEDDTIAQERGELEQELRELVRRDPAAKASLLSLVVEDDDDPGALLESGIAGDHHEQGGRPDPECPTRG